MGLAILLAVGFAVFWAALVALTLRSLLYPPRRTFAWCVSRGQPADPGALTPARAFEEGSIREPRRGGAELPYWVIEGDDPAGPVVIFSHGWGESKQSVLQRLDALAPVCAAVVAWDLPGHGGASPGPTRLGTSEWRGLHALVDMFAGRPVVLQGFSLGAGVSIRAAAEGAPVAGVIAEAPYRQPRTPARNVMALMGSPYRLNLSPALLVAGLGLESGARWRGFDRAALARKITCPLLVVHGTADEMCPVEDGRAIAGAVADGRLVEVRGATHSGLWTDPARGVTADAVRLFLREVSAGLAPAP